MRWNQETYKKVSKILKIWFFMLVILSTSITTLQTIQYLKLKDYNQELLFELNETNLAGYDESIEMNRIFNLGSYTQSDLFDDYRYEFYNVVNNITITVEIDNFVVIRTPVSTNETYNYTFFRGFTRSQLELQFFSRRAAESLQFDMRVIKLTNSQEVANFGSDFLELVIFEILMLVLVFRWGFGNSWARNLFFHGVSNSLISILLLKLTI